MDQRLVQTQRLMLTQKMQQAIHILQLSSLELEAYLQQELETNPVLDQVVKEPPLPEPEPLKADQKERDELDDMAFDLDKYRDSFRHEGGARNRDLESRREHYENSITGEESFTSRILTQLRFADLDERNYKIGERIVGDIDGRGYFTGSLEEIAQELNAPLEDVERVLHRIQKFEPTGIGARDVVECLLLQIAIEFPNEPELSELVEHHLEDLERRQIPKIAKAMNITPDRVEQLKTMLATLNPWPGHEYDTQPTHYVTPDVIVEKTEDDQFIVRLAEDWVPELHISPRYKQMVTGGQLDRADKQYIRSKLESAHWLIRNIEQRRSTILRIAEAIVGVQKEFLLKGIDFFVPLTLQQIADKVGVHEATVSRATKGKYMQTPQGLYELKFFFSPGLQRDTGDAQSSKSVMSMIRKMIDSEDKAKPLSDQKIADILTKHEGISIARRTVTKYREAMGILSTSMRRTYNDAS